MKHGLIVAMEASAQNASAGLKDFDRGTSPGKSMPRKVVIRESYRRVSASNLYCAEQKQPTPARARRCVDERAPVLFTANFAADRSKFCSLTYQERTNERIAARKRAAVSSSGD
jgi:hypothetical protein